MNEAMDYDIRILLGVSHALIGLGLQSALAEDDKLEIIGLASQWPDLVYMTQRNKPHIILLDTLVILPLMAKHIAELHQISSNSKVLLLAITDHSHSAELEAFQSGAAGYVSKQQTTEMLIKAIYQLYAGELWFDAQITQTIWQSFNQAKGLPFKVNPQSPFNISLTEREWRIAHLASQGTKAKQIGEQLCISEKTVRNQLSIIYDKLGVDGQVELCLKATELGLYTA